MADLLEFDAARFCRRFLAQGYNGHHGLRYVAHGEDWIELALPAGGGTGFGRLLTLLDMAGTIAVWVRAGLWRPHATVDCRIDEWEAMDPGVEWIGHARCTAIAGQIAFVQGHARPTGGDSSACSSATYMFTDR